jgi:mediator of RNA polymerase II transcription subunit 17, fungi type
MQTLSSVTNSERNSEDLPVEALLVRARDSIYDEELYHEMHREARDLTNQGVRSIDGMISLPYEHDKHIEIDLLPSLEENSSQPEINICAGIALSLRILLSHAHHQNLRRRSQPPPPLREGKPPRPTYRILTPVLEHLQHNLQVKLTDQLLHDLRGACLKAGFDLRFHRPKPPYGLASLAPASIQADIHATEALVDELTQPRHSSTIVCLPTGLTELKVEIQTSLHPHISGTAYQCTIMSSAPGSYIPRIQPVIQFPSFDAFEDHVMHLIKLDIVALLASEPDAENGWTIVSPHDAQLSRANMTTQRSDRIWVSVQRDCIRLKWRRAQQKRNGEGTVKWDSTTTTHSGEKIPSLIAKIQEIFGDEP